jgi:hypothetical protein
MKAIRNGVTRAGSGILQDSCATCHKDSKKSEDHMFTKIAAALDQSPEASGHLRLQFSSQNRSVLTFRR